MVNSIEFRGSPSERATEAVNLTKRGTLAVH
jgi:hypothetical protein